MCLCRKKGQIHLEPSKRKNTPENTQIGTHWKFLNKKKETTTKEREKEGREK